MVAHALPGIFVIGCLVYLMESYVIRCPEQAEWNIRAEIQCQNTAKYFCLYNDLNYTYKEGCTGPDWDRSGSKCVYSGNFNRAPCNDTRYQPIKFVTNGNSDCIFRKSLCTEEGQILFTNGTTKTDSTCRCDYKQGYAFVTVPRNNCPCRPSEEDCSCYLKKCQGIGYYLSADYECTNDITKKTDCPIMSENPSEDAHIDMELPGTPRENDSYAIRRKFDVVIVVLVCIFGMIVTTMCLVFHQRLSRCPQQCIKQDGIRLEETVSGNNDDNQIALRESDKNLKYLLKKLKVNIKKKGLDAALKHLKEDLENWRNEAVKLAVTGKSGLGKSSFINAIPNSQDDIMDIIYKQLKERALKISSTSKCLAIKPISNMDKRLIISLICKELLSYRKAFGFEQQCVKDIFKDDHIRQKLNASSIVEIQPTDEAMRKFVENKFIESGEDTLRLLNQVLDGCRDDDKLVRLLQRNLTGNTESKGIGTGPSLETIYQNGSNHEPAGNTESKRMGTGPSLETIHQNGSNHEPAGNTESKRMGTGPSLETIYQNGSNHEPGVKKKHKGFDNKW